MPGYVVGTYFYGLVKSGKTTLFCLPGLSEFYHLNFTPFTKEMVNSSPTPNTIPPGWVGGFEQSNPAFAYPKCDLTSLPLLDNMANIGLLQRQLNIKWPEFTWLTVPGVEESRCFQMFSPYISRVGYTDEGRIYSIICPQQGIWLKSLGATLNVEVTVTRQRGWVDESTPDQVIAADMEVKGKIWFSFDDKPSFFVKLLKQTFTSSGLSFPTSKANAIVVNTYDPNNPSQSYFPVRSGVCPHVANPEFAKHSEAWSVAHTAVTIGNITPTEDTLLDDFNSLVMDLFNLASGNILCPGNTLVWNVWFTPPTLVNQKEWQEHAEKWRHSIDVNHVSPTGPSTPARYYNGQPFVPVEELIYDKIQEIIDWMVSHLSDFAKRQNQTLPA